MKLSLKNIKLPEAALDLFRDTEKVVEIAQAAVEEADEVLSAEPGVKRLEAVARTLNQFVDIPYLPEGIEAILFRMLAQVAYGFVRKLGKKPSEA